MTRWKWLYLIGAGFIVVLLTALHVAVISDSETVEGIAVIWACTGIVALLACFLTWLAWKDDI